MLLQFPAQQGLASPSRMEKLDDREGFTRGSGWTWLSTGVNPILDLHWAWLSRLATIHPTVCNRTNRHKQDRQTNQMKVNGTCQMNPNIFILLCFARVRIGASWV